MALSGILADFRTHIVYTVYITIHKIRFIYIYIYHVLYISMCTYTTSGAKANGTTTPCAVASGQAARQSPCIIPSEGRQHRRVTLILFPHVSKCFQCYVKTFHHLCASQDFMGICRFRQGWSGERELKPRNRHIGPTATRIFQFIQEEAPWNFPEQVAVSQIRRKGFFPFVALRKDNQKYCGR